MELKLKLLMTDVLVEHQRKDIGGCLCGWSKLGESFAGHQADEILARIQEALA